MIVEWRTTRWKRAARASEERPAPRGVLGEPSPAFDLPVGNPPRVLVVEDLEGRPEVSRCSTIKRWVVSTGGDVPGATALSGSGVGWHESVDGKHGPADGASRVVQRNGGGLTTHPDVPTCQRADMLASLVVRASLMGAGAKDEGRTAQTTVALTVRVPRELRQRLRVFAAEQDVSVQQCTVEAVQAWLEQQQPDTKVAP